MKIHVVCFQIPLPADYGGVIDVWYKLKAMRRAGFNITLHCYYYGREPGAERLDEVCDAVHYYPRRLGLLRQLSPLPYIVSSRDDARLLTNLLADTAPIFFEGIHCCRLLNHPELKNRLKIVRMHNIEHQYYWLLARQNPTNWRAIYYSVESLKLRLFERQLQHADVICAISQADQQALANRFPRQHTMLLPCFFDTEMPARPASDAPFVLYHGNLAVEENVRAAKFIINHIAPLLPDVRFVIAGSNPHFKSTADNVQIVGNPTTHQLQQLLSQARIHLMLTFQPTGIKLKLLTVIVKSQGHIIANSDMLHGHDLGSLCIRADQPDDIVTQIRTQIGYTLPDTEMERRKTKIEAIEQSQTNALQALITHQKL